VSKRSKRRRGPQAAGGERPDDTGRTPEASEEAVGGSGEARRTSGRGTGRRSGKARQASGQGAGGRSGKARQASGRGSGEARQASGRGSGVRSGEAPQHGRGTQSRPAAASDWGLAVQIAFLAGVFGVVVLIAELAGAANLGVAVGVGQIAFAIAVIFLLLRR
jgi:hypothetical protein